MDDLSHQGLSAGTAYKPVERTAKRRTPVGAPLLGRLQIL